MSTDRTPGYGQHHSVYDSIRTKLSLIIILFPSPNIHTLCSLFLFLLIQCGNPLSFAVYGPTVSNSFIGIVPMNRFLKETESESTWNSENRKQIESSTENIVNRRTQHIFHRYCCPLMDMVLYQMMIICIRKNK